MKLFAIILALVLPAPAMADPLSAAIAATAAEAIVAGGVAAAFRSVGKFVLAIGLRAGLGYAINALSREAPVTTPGTGYRVNPLGPALPHALIYGRTRVGGPRFYQAVSGASNEYLHMCFAMAGHEIDGYEKIYLGEDEVTLDASGNVTWPAKYFNKVRIKQYFGTATQTADPDLVAEVPEWKNTAKGQGIAYLYVRFMGRSNFPDGPPIVTALVRGRKVFDPRTGTTAHSSNPALCIRDYLTSSFGLGAPVARIDDTAVAVAANICDEVVGTQKRYACDGVVTMDAAPEVILKALVSSMAGILPYAQGKWSPLAAAYRTPVLDLGEDDLRGAENVVTRIAQRDRFNTVRGTYSGPLTNYQDADYTAVTDAAALADDGGVELVHDLPLPFTRGDLIAQRVATVALRRHRRETSIEAPFGLRALTAGIGDTVRLTLPDYGWQNKEFEVIDWNFSVTEEGDMVFPLTLREIDAGVFADG